MFKNRKAAWQGGSLNYQNAGSADGESVFDYAQNLENLQSNIFKMIAPAPKVKQLFRCEGCQKGKSAEKFSVFRVVCRECLAEMKTKSKLAQSNFIEKALNNFRKNLKGAIQ